MMGSRVETVMGCYPRTQESLIFDYTLLCLFSCRSSVKAVIDWIKAVTLRYLARIHKTIKTLHRKIVIRDL